MGTHISSGFPIIAFPFEVIFCMPQAQFVMFENSAHNPYLEDLKNFRPYLKNSLKLNRLFLNCI